MDIKSELLSIMVPIFGKEVEKLIMDNYASDKPEELIELAHHMLSGYMGEKTADRMLQKLLKKFPDLKIPADEKGD